MELSRLQQLIQELLSELGEDPRREGLLQTPRRFAELLATFAVPKPPLPADLLIAPVAAEAPGEMLLVRDLNFMSLCEHHLLPFYGRLHIGCIPRQRSCDVSGYAEVIAHYAHRLQLQERLTEQIADALFEALQPEGLGVVAEGRHMCMMMRGVAKQNSEIRTSALRGCFFEPITRRAFFTQVSAPVRNAESA